MFTKDAGTLYGNKFESYQDLMVDDIENPKPIKKTRTAICTSVACTGRSMSNPNSSKVIENVSKYAIDCPYCGEALLWRLT